MQAFFTGTSIRSKPIKMEHSDRKLLFLWVNRGKGYWLGKGSLVFSCHRKGEGSAPITRNPGCSMDSSVASWRQSRESKFCVLSVFCIFKTWRAVLYYIKCNLLRQGIYNLLWNLLCLFYYKVYSGATQRLLSVALMKKMPHARL